MADGMCRRILVLGLVSITVASDGAAEESHQEL